MDLIYWRKWDWLKGVDGGIVVSVSSCELYVLEYLQSGSKGGDNESNIQFLGVSDFGYWLKGNIQEFSSF